MGRTNTTDVPHGPCVHGVCLGPDCPCRSLSAPRLREVLHRLMNGDSEKEAASVLGIAQSTLHQYVESIYRRFGVSSRAGLLAQIMHGIAVAPATPSAGH